MIKLLCVGLAVAACLAGAAVAADLSMTPIYKSRPSASSALDGSLKAEYRPLNFFNQPPANATAGPSAKLRWTMNNRAVRAGMAGRF
jgi:hypothetical protein